MENDKMMSKVLTCLYIIIALLAINTLVLIIANVDSGSDSDNAETSAEESGEYDVSMFDEVTVDDIDEMKETEGLQVVYIGRATCGYCVAFLPSLQQAQSEYGYETKYLDISKITDEDGQNKVLELDNDEKFISENFGSTPMVLILEDGKLKDGWIGYDEYDAFTEFLEENGITK